MIIRSVSQARWQWLSRERERNQISDRPFSKSIQFQEDDCNPNHILQPSSLLFKCNIEINTRDGYMTTKETLKQSLLESAIKSGKREGRAGKWLGNGRKAGDWFGFSCKLQLNAAEQGFGDGV